jgi:hypothetical protein
VPSYAFVEYIQARGPEWGRRGAGWITAFPSVVNAFGFLATPLWLLIIALNLVLLAQSLEVFMPGGDRVEIPFFGSYTWLSLLAGLLFSLSQSVFGVIAGENKRRSIVVLCLLLVVLSIGVEMGLAGYRSWLIMTHALDVDATTTDSLLSKGVALTMFISFLVPVAHTALGFIAIPRFLVPLANYFPRLVGGFLVLIWSWFARFYFGFQRVVNVPASIKLLRTDTMDLKSRVAQTHEGCGVQQKNLLDLRDMGSPFSDLQAQADQVAAEAGAIRKSWVELAGRVAASDAVSAPARATDEERARAMEELERFIEELTTFKTGTERRVRDNIGDAKRLIALLDSLPKVDQNWHTKHEQALSALPSVAAPADNAPRPRGRLTLETEQEWKDLESYRARLARCVLTLDPPPETNLPERITGADTRPVEDLEYLRRQLREAKTKSERDGVGRVIAYCTEQLGQTKKDLDAAERDVLFIMQTLADLCKKLTWLTAPPPAPPAQAIDAERRKLNSAIREMVTASYEVAPKVDRLKAKLGKDLRKVTGKKGGIFGWIGRLFTDFVDAIMGANSEKGDAENGKGGENGINPSVNLNTGGRES